MLRSFLVAAILSLMLAACGELPRPFQHAPGGAPTSLIELRMDVRLYPLVDIPADAAVWLNRALVDAFGAEGLTAARSDDVDARFALDGVYQPTDAKAGVVRWTLRQGDGTEVETRSLAVDLGPGDWRPESADRIRAVAGGNGGRVRSDHRSDSRELRSAGSRRRGGGRGRRRAGRRERSPGARH